MFDRHLGRLQVLCPQGGSGYQHRGGRLAGGAKQTICSSRPAEGARKQEYGDLIDPRNFYRCSGVEKSWEQIQEELSELKGDKGAEIQQKASDQLKVDQADYEGGAWYRLRQTAEPRNGSELVSTSVWSPLAGFNPVSRTVSMKDNAGESITIATSWKWKTVDGIFVPEEFHHLSHPKSNPENADSLNQTLTLKECVLNAPLAPNQFDYSALGLKAGAPRIGRHRPNGIHHRRQR